MHVKILNIQNDMKTVSENSHNWVVQNLKNLKDRMRKLTPLDLALVWWYPTCKPHRFLIQMRS